MANTIRKAVIGGALLVAGQVVDGVMDHVQLKAHVLNLRLQRVLAQLRLGPKQLELAPHPRVAGKQKSRSKWA